MRECVRFQANFEFKFFQINFELLMTEKFTFCLNLMLFNIMKQSKILQTVKRSLLEHNLV